MAGKMAAMGKSFPLVEILRTWYNRYMFVLTDIPGDYIKKYLDPKNCVSFSITETSPGCFDLKTTISNIPEWNNTCTLKIGELTELKIPFEYSITLTKKNDNTFNMKM